MSITAENTENLQEIEQQWAVKALTHAEAYMSVLSARHPSKLTNLTGIDSKIYEHFRSMFPTLNIEILDEDNDFKSPEAKAKWREFIMQYEKPANAEEEKKDLEVIKDYNFGSLLRTNCHHDYSAENSMLVVRVQFWAIEIARNREGFNTEFCKESSS
ncbi:Protein PBDC1 [Zancudomyces culisetae]|uniref:Protein PBDC1 n=1 Tax=Zancudomyces culisetae TaxID=1213189 RepID=A0A1R1PT23_ZANCU|nr:Protein PBDC1 [Zancudomyces culisetae]|eukprot:OMH84053.1 Protein PBDC1 [Zancudomyces culisetae]